MLQGTDGHQRSASAGTAKGAEIFELKSASVTAMSLVLHGRDLAAMDAALQVRFGDNPELFNHDPVVIDLSHLETLSTASPDAQPVPDASGQLPLQAAADVLDLSQLLALLRRHRMHPVGVIGASASELAQAQALGLAELPPSSAPARQESRAEPVEVVREVIREVVVEREVPAEAARTMVIDKPLRSGQRVYAKGCDLVVLALVSHGAEVIADGHIHVYAPLRGKAIAGARGNTDARIFASCLEAELVAIAGIYRTTENPLPAHVAGRAAQIRLEGEKMVMEALGD